MVGSQLQGPGPNSHRPPSKGLTLNEDAPPGFLNVKLEGPTTAPTAVNSKPPNQYSCITIMRDTTVPPLQMYSYKTIEVRTSFGDNLLRNRRLMLVQVGGSSSGWSTFWTLLASLAGIVFAPTLTVGGPVLGHLSDIFAHLGSIPALLFANPGLTGSIRYNAPSIAATTSINLHMARPPHRTPPPSPVRNLCPLQAPVELRFADDHNYRWLVTRNSMAGASNRLRHVARDVATKCAKHVEMNNRKQENTYIVRYVRYVMK